MQYKGGLEVGVTKETVDLVVELSDQKRINYTKMKTLALF